MPEQQESIFRREALEQRGRRRAEGNVVRVAPRWTTGAFYLLLALVAVGITAASVVRVDRYASGPTAVDDGRVIVLLPASLAPHVDVGRPVDLNGASERVVAFREDIVYPAEARERYGVEVSVPSVAVVTSAVASSSGDGAGRVLVESEPAIVALIPGLDALFGGD